MENDQILTPRRRAPWLALGLVGAAAALVVGLAWTLTTLGGPKLMPVGVGTATEVEDATAGHRRPADYDLPTYPTAFAFSSLEMGRTDGSVAYSVKGANSRQVADFYRKELPKKGWRFQSEQQISLMAGEGSKAVAANGWKQRWVKPALDRKLTLQALDLKGEHRPSQVALNWSPRDN